MAFSVISDNSLINIRIPPPSKFICTNEHNIEWFCRVYVCAWLVIKFKIYRKFSIKLEFTKITIFKQIYLYERQILRSVLLVNCSRQTKSATWILVGLYFNTIRYWMKGSLKDIWVGAEHSCRVYKTCSAIQQKKKQTTICLCAVYMRNSYL